MNKLIIIHIDGFSYDYIDKSSTPFLNSFSQRGLARRMAPSVFFQSNMSAYTGKEAVSHNRIVEYIYDSSNSPFAGFKRFGHILDRFDRCMPYQIQKFWRYGLSWLYTTLFRQPAVKLHFIPFSISPNFNFSFNDMYIKGDDIFSMVRRAGLRTAWDDEDFVANVKRRWMGTYFYRFYPGIMTDWAMERIKGGIDLIWVDLGAELDRCGHRYGPDKSKFLGVLKKIDQNLERLVTMAEKHHYHFIVFSDHGMESVRGEIDISGRLNTKGLINGRDYLAFYDSTLARFWARDSGVLQKIKAEAANLGHGRCIEQKDSIDIGVPLNKSIGELLFAVEQGYIILPNFYQGKKMVRGMHGYLGQRQGPLDGIFISDMAKGVGHSYSDNRQRVKDIASLTLKAIGIR